MYSWNVQALAQELKTNQLPEGEKMKYLLAGLVLEAVLEIPSAGAAMDTAAAYASWIIGIAVTVGGVYLCYEANQLGDNRDFITRFICLNWPITVRLIVYFLVPLLLLALIESRVEDGSYEDRIGVVFVELVLIVTITVAFYLWMRAQLLWISGALDRKNDQPTPQG